MKKKRHHYIPKTYSRNFSISEDDPNLYVYKKGETGDPFKAPPINIGIETQYYSFKKPEGEIDTNSLEEMFSISESIWPEIIKKFQNKGVVYPEDVNNLCTFMALMHVRVPNFRIKHELSHAEWVRTTGMMLSQYNKNVIADYRQRLREAEERGDTVAIESLHKAKEGLDSGKVRISVDPQTSLMGIEQLDVIHKHLMELNWAVFDNNSAQDFVTSDNPAIWFDGASAKKSFVPYKKGLANRHIEVIFPLTKRLLLAGNRKFKEKFDYGYISSPARVKEINRYIVISAEDYIYSSQNHLLPLVKKYSHIAPRTTYNRIPHKENGKKGYLLVTEPTLGNRVKPEKWKN